MQSTVVFNDKKIYQVQVVLLINENLMQHKLKDVDHPQTNKLNRLPAGKERLCCLSQMLQVEC